MNIHKVLISVCACCNGIKNSNNDPIAATDIMLPPGTELPLRIEISHSHGLCNRCMVYAKSKHLDFINALKQLFTKFKVKALHPRSIASFIGWHDNGFAILHTHIEMGRPLDSKKPATFTGNSFHITENQP